MEFFFLMHPVCVCACGVVGEF